MHTHMVMKVIHITLTLGTKLYALRLTYEREREYGLCVCMWGVVALDGPSLEKRVVNAKGGRQKGTGLFWQNRKEGM